ncbi:hypothetical protein NLJ89_g9070 [Agrocybe chaxingu]|uniref:Uncharacterized protein n=1 Tax=Agrocybe chaxingu TaxID=84603 RepID=A0A9W8MRK3_9AGAR|nr:hypothetical protein NLJ89_g9070 [Agrocybe chaxingu]
MCLDPSRTLNAADSLYSGRWSRCWTSHTHLQPPFYHTLLQSNDILLPAHGFDASPTRQAASEDIKADSASHPNPAFNYGRDGGKSSPDVPSSPRPSSVPQSTASKQSSPDIKDVNATLT